MSFNDTASSDRAGFQERLARFTASRKPKLEEHSGTIERVQMFNPDWGLATMWTEDRVELKLTGKVGELREGGDYTITGTLKSHPKYGQSVDILSAKPFVRLEQRAIVRFLKDNFKNIGDASARKFVQLIVEQDGEAGLVALREKLLNEPWSIDFSSIGREGTFDGSEKDKTVRAFVLRSLSTRIVGLASNVLGSLADYLVNQLAKIDGGPLSAGSAEDPVERAWALLAQNPYAPIKSVPGYGFAAADTVGRGVNIPKTAPVRLAALVEYAIAERCRAMGHVYLTLGQARAAIAEMDGSIDGQTALEHALEAETVQLDDEFGESRIYTGRLLDRERALAKRIAAKLIPGDPLMRDRDGTLREKIQAQAKAMGGAFKNGLDPSQLEAVYGIVTSRVRLHTITAEPGAGKTAVMEVVTRLLKNKQFVLCAPTGKGAKVLNNRVSAIGLTASTIHSTLQGDPEGGFRYDRSNKLEGDMLVPDESSMLDLMLAAAVFDATHDDMHVLCLGDHMQLLSVDPGSFLVDLMQIERIDHHRLNCVHRNAGGILQVIREVRQGFINPVNRDGVTFSGTLPSASNGFETVMREYLDAVRQHGYERVALLMSRRKGDVDEAGWNTTYANARLRAVCNPNAEKIPGSTLCVNDRIMITANINLSEDDESSDRVVNGDTGRILGFVRSDDKRKGAVATVQIQLDDGRKIDFPGGQLSAIELGYALTVHKSQGSEYAKVICVITPGVPTFINQNMLLTGLSRARTALSVHASDADLRKIAATPAPKRNSGLVERVLRELGETQGEGAAERGASAQRGGPGSPIPEAHADPAYACDVVPIEREPETFYGDLDEEASSGPELDEPEVPKRSVFASLVRPRRG